MRVAAVQMPHGDSLQGNLAVAEAMVQQAQHTGCRLAVLPEYFFATFRPGDGQPDAAREVRAFLARASRDIAVAAHAVEGRAGALRNVGLLYDGGKELMAQPKVQVMPREAAMGLQGWDGGFATARLDGANVGMLVCADILFPESAVVLAGLGADIVLNPVMSSRQAADPSRAAREGLFVARAYDMQAFVVKAGGFRGGEPAVAGRSLVAAPWGLVAKYRDDAAPELLVADLDLEALAAFRAGQARFPQRRPSAYWQLGGGR